MEETPPDRETLVYLARLAEQAERYDEMAKCMKTVVEMKEELNAEERNILSVGYKNVTGVRRGAWRIVTSVEKKEKNKGHEENSMAVEHYRVKIEEELRVLCMEIIGLLNDFLIPVTSDGESKISYLKMKGDYYRYMAEIVEGDELKSAIKNATESYEASMEIASTELEVTSPIRLGLALNFSVFYYEVVKNQEEACKMARTAFEDAIADLENLQEDFYKDSTLIMQLLRDNLTLWTSD